VITPALVDWLVQGLAVAVVATLVVRLVPATSASQRHVFWWTSLVAILALPWTPFLAGAAARMDANALLSPGPIVASPFSVPTPAPAVVWTLLALWCAVSLAGLARLARNLVVVQRLAASARPFDQPRLRRMTHVALASQHGRAVRVCVSSRIRGACAVGFRRPSILVSTDLVATLDDEALEAIILHEHAHLQRRDDWTRLLQRVVLCVGGLHPAVRWVSRQIDLEREAACDRLVVSRTEAPLAYARSLTTAAELSARMGGLTALAAPGATAYGAGLHARMSRLLLGRVVSRRASWTRTAASLIVVVLCAGASTAMPPLVGVVADTPLLTLVSVPVASARLAQLPAGPDSLSRAADEEARTGPEPVRAPTRPVPRPSTMTASSERPALIGEADPQLPHAGEVASGEPLVGRALEPIRTALTGVPLRPETGRTPRALTSPSRLGVAAGDVAARAGTSIGRFFKSGGQTIASRF
jgi:beta-lactamase regulating signal transducer with metallopeptidase domain